MYKIPATTLFLGKNLIFMPECHSTNDTLLLLCQKENLPEGTLVITSSQTAGRGQRGNVWEAQKDKNLTFSFLLKPSFLPVIKQFYLNIFVSLGISDFLTTISGEKVQIKWPNDILLQEKKVSGILIEGKNNKEWMLLDYIDVVAHVFRKDRRDFYALEKLWGDAEIIEIDDQN